MTIWQFPQYKSVISEEILDPTKYPQVCLWIHFSIVKKTSPIKPVKKKTYTKIKTSVGISKKLFAHTDWKLCTSSSLLWLCKYCWRVGRDMGALPSWISFHIAVIFFPPSAHNCNQSFTHLVFPPQPPWLLLGMSRPLLYGNICHEMSDCVLVSNVKTQKKMLIIAFCAWGAKVKLAWKHFTKNQPPLTARIVSEPWIMAFFSLFFSFYKTSVNTVLEESCQSETFVHGSNHPNGNYSLEAKG